MSEDQDWRMRAELDGVDTRGALDHAMDRLRPHDHELDEELKAAVAHDVVISHDGERLFAYANTEEALRGAQRAIEAVLQREGIKASVSISHWDHDIDDWLQVDPPLSGEELRNEQAREHDAESLETRTLVAGAGNLIKSSFEQTMLRYADSLDLKCEIVDHRHLLTTQIAFTVSGPKRKIDEFSQGLRAEGWATIRAEGNMLNPL
jgi:hypothetical protein